MKTVDLRKKEKVTLFNALAIETSALCNRTCVFCPNHQNARPDEYMPLSLLHKAAEELAELKYKGRLTTYLYNEPTRDKRLLDILAMFHTRVPMARLMVSTNGDYLKGKGDIEKLLDAGVRQLQINIYSASDGHADPKVVARGVETARKREQQMLKWVGDIPYADQKASVHANIPASKVAVRVEPKYGMGQDSKKLARFELQNRSGNITWFKPTIKEPLARTCTRPFRMMNVNWRGDGILCCNDYHGSVPMGNLQTHTLVEMWNSYEMNKYRLALQDKNRNLPLCDVCDYGGGAYPHMVDTLKR